MKAIVYHGYGDETVLRLEEVPEPKVSADRALLRVKAAGVNPADYHVRNGLMDQTLNIQFPVTPGWDVSGVIERVGYLAEGFTRGDEVMGYAWMDFLHHGSYAEYMAVPLRTLVHKPDTLSWDQAAALPLAGLSAYQAIKRVGITAGNVVLAHGAAGGTGSIGVQILRLLGGKVIGSASPANHDFLRSLGVTPIVYGDDLHDAVREHAPDGVDVVVDSTAKGRWSAPATSCERAGAPPTWSPWPTAGQRWLWEPTSSASSPSPAISSNSRRRHVDRSGHSPLPAHPSGGGAAAQRCRTHARQDRDPGRPVRTGRPRGATNVTRDRE